MEEVCLDEEKFKNTSYEWATLILNFNHEIQQPNPKWWSWTTSACYYRGKVMRQIQIVMSEMLLHHNIDPWQILSTDVPEQFDRLPIDGQKALAKIYCAKLMYIVQESIKQLRN